MCTKTPLPLGGGEALGLQAFTSLPNLVKEMVLMTAVSSHPCGTARAGSVLTAGREQGAQCPPPSTSDGQHPPQGRTWRVCTCSIALLNLVPFCAAAELAALSQGHRQRLGIPSGSSPKHHTGSTGLQGERSAVSGSAWREGTTCTGASAATGPMSSARSHDLLGVWDGGICLRKPHDLEGFSISPQLWALTCGERNP